jgi:hypothetical protein
MEIQIFKNNKIKNTVILEVKIFLIIFLSITYESIHHYHGRSYPKDKYFPNNFQHFCYDENHDKMLQRLMEELEMGSIRLDIQNVLKH